MTWEERRLIDLDNFQADLHVVLTSDGSENVDNISQL